MPEIIKRGGTVTCSHCQSVLSFKPYEVNTSFKRVPAGSSPEEEAYDKPSFGVKCPHCSVTVNVESSLGPDGKRAAVERARARSGYDDDI